MVIILATYFGIRYLDGDLTVKKEEIIKQVDIINASGTKIGTCYEIKRVYQSGRIKMYMKNLII